MNSRLAALIIGVLGAIPSVSRVDAQVVIKIDETPEPRTFGELRKLSKLDHVEQCRFPTVETPGIGTTLKTFTGSLIIDIPGKWDVIASDTIKTPMHEPEFVYQSESEARVAVSRVASGVSRTFLADPVTMEPRKADDCEVTADTAGVIWAFYTPPSARPEIRPRFVALGDAVTPRGQRYKFRIGAWSTSERDSLASHISNAVMRK